MSRICTTGERAHGAVARGPVARTEVAVRSAVAEATMHAQVRYDQFVEWSRPVLEKYSARPSTHVFTPQV